MLLVLGPQGLLELLLLLVLQQRLLLLLNVEWVGNGRRERHAGQATVYRGVGRRGPHREHLGAED